jgi:hypothetical protein
LGGFVLGGKDGKRFYPEGYDFEDVGPDRKRGAGKKEMQGFEERIRAARSAGCPFATR